MVKIKRNSLGSEQCANLEDSRIILVINGVLLPHGWAVGALTHNGHLQPEQGPVSPGLGPNQGDFELVSVCCVQQARRLEGSARFGEGLYLEIQRHIICGE